MAKKAVAVKSKPKGRAKAGAKVSPGKKKPAHLPRDWQKQIKDFRAGGGISQERLAGLMGVHWQTIHRWESSPPKFFPSKFVWARFQQVQEEVRGATSDK